MQPHVEALADLESGLADVSRQPTGVPWQEPDGGYVGFASRAAGGRTDLFATVDTQGRTNDRRADFDEVYGDWASVADDAAQAAGRAAPQRLDADIKSALAIAADDPELPPTHATSRWPWRCSMPRGQPSTPTCRDRR